MRNRVPWSFALLLVLAFPASASAEDAELLLWRCWYDPERPAVACRLDHAPEGGGTAFADDPERAPAMVRMLRSDPGSLSGEQIVIPLHSPPIDMNQAARLARAVMCRGHGAACRVDWSVAPPA